MEPTKEIEPRSYVTIRKKKNIKPPGDAERVISQTRNPSDLRCQWNFRQIKGKDIEISENQTKLMFTVVRSHRGTRHIWSMIEVANTALKLLPPAVYMRWAMEQWNTPLVSLPLLCSVQKSTPKRTDDVSLVS